MDDFRKRRIRARVAWGVLALIVVIAVWGQGRRTAPSGEPIALPGLNKQFTATAKSTIGMERLLGDMGGSALPMLDWLAQTPELKVDAAIVAMEVEGRDEALKRLDAIDSNGSEDLARDISDVRLAIGQGGAALDESAQQRLIERHGYFGELAGTFGKGDSDPSRARILEQARTLAILLLAGEIFAGMIGLAGLILLIVAVVFWFEGRLRPLYVPRSDEDPVWLEFFVAQLVLQLILSVVLMQLLRGAPLLVAWMLSAPVALLASFGLPLARGVSPREIFMALGLHRGKGFLREAGSGVIGYVAGMPFIIVGFLITLALVRLSPVPPSHPLLAEPSSSVWNVLSLYLLASVGAPVVEEIAFRGALFHHLRRRLNAVASALLIALIFAAIHPQGWTTIPALGAIAVVLAALREWRGSLIAPIVAHGLSNGLVVTLSLLVQ